MTKSKVLQMKKYINIATRPFRAIYATVAAAVWEILSFGVITPYIIFLWNQAYEFLEIDEK